MPAFWRSWFVWLNPLTYVVSGLVTNELHDLRVTCTANELNIFQPPSGQTCAQWASSFVASAGGYLANPQATADCGYCQYSVGDQFYAPLNIDYDKRWRDVWILFCYFSTSPFSSFP